MLARGIAIVAAFCLGWIIYMIAMILTVYDGLLSMIFQPFMAALCSAIFVVLALVVGLLLRIPIVARWWTSTPAWAASLAALSLLLLTCGYSLGLSYVGRNPETGEDVMMLHPVAALAGYFCAVFAVANWPTRRRRLEPEPNVG